jgi:hypothetical protein
MNLVVTLEHLRKARRFVVDGEKCMVRQRKIVDRMDRQGFDTLNAILFLEYLEEMQSQYVALRDQLERQLLVLVRPDE